MTINNKKQTSKKIYTDIGWVKETTYNKALAFIKTIRNEDIINIKKYAEIIEIKYKSKNYGWGNINTITKYIK